MMGFLDIDRPPQSLSTRGIFISTVLFMGLGMWAGGLIFKGHSGLVGIFLLALAEARIVAALLERNRRQIWEEGMAPLRANRMLARALMVIFLGVFVTALVAVLVMASADVQRLFAAQLKGYEAGEIINIYFGGVAEIFRHNAKVVLGCFLLALVYRHGGMLLVLAWNASRWGVIFAWMARGTASDDLMVSAQTLGLSLVVVMPHLIVEALAYILVAMSGVFLSKSLSKYRLGSAEFTQVGWAVVRLFLFGLFLLGIAAFLEGRLAPWLVTTLF